MGSLYLWGHSIQEMDGDVVIGRSIYGVVLIDESLCSQFYGISNTLWSYVPCLYGNYHPVWLPIVGWTSSVVSIMYRLRLWSHPCFVWHKPFIMKSILDSSCSGRCQCCIHDRRVSSILHCMIWVITFTYNVHILHSSLWYSNSCVCETCHCYFSLLTL